MLKDFIRTIRFKLKYPVVVVDNRIEELERRVRNLENMTDILAQSPKPSTTLQEADIRYDNGLKQIQENLTQFHQGYKTLGQKIREYEHKSLGQAREKGLVK